MIAVNWSDLIRSWTRAHMSSPSTWHTSSRCFRGRSSVREGWQNSGIELGYGPPRLDLAWSGRWSPVLHTVGITDLQIYYVHYACGSIFMRSARLSTGAKCSSRACMGRQLRAVSQHMLHGTIAAMQILWWLPTHRFNPFIRSEDLTDMRRARRCTQ